MRWWLLTDMNKWPFYREKKLLDSWPLTPSLEKEKDARLVASPLKFPGKLATDLVNGRLFISDSNHHRIVCAKVDLMFCFGVMQLSCRWLVGVDKREWM
jgi:hypothetical protein